MKVNEKMSKDFTKGYNEAVRDILSQTGMWCGLKKELQKKLKSVLEPETESDNPRLRVLGDFIYTDKAR